MFKKFRDIKDKFSNFMEDRWNRAMVYFFLLVLVIITPLCLFDTKVSKESEVKVISHCEVTCEIPEVNGFVISTVDIGVKYDIEKLRFERIPLKSIRLTAYNNHPNQTSSSPNTFASGRIVYEGGVAISQDILDKYQLKYGDLVFIPKMDKYYVYEDKMAYGRKDGERTIKNTVDIFMFSYDIAKTFHHTNEDIIIYKLARNQ